MPERGRADDEDEVVPGQRLAKCAASGRQVTGELRMILREPGSSAERFLPDGASESFGEHDECVPGPIGVCARARADGECASAGG